jgi:hypothetical protein
MNRDSIVHIVTPTRNGVGLERLLGNIDETLKNFRWKWWIIQDGTGQFPDPGLNEIINARIEQDAKTKEGSRIVYRVLPGAPKPTYSNKGRPLSHSGNPLRNYALDQIETPSKIPTGDEMMSGPKTQLEDGVVLFLDDDNLLHPALPGVLFKFLQDGDLLDIEGITVRQQYADGWVRLRPKDSDPPLIDVACLLVRVKALRGARFCVDPTVPAEGWYAADQDFFQELYTERPRYWEHEPIFAALYNALDPGTPTFHYRPGVDTPGKTVLAKEKVSAVKPLTRSYPKLTKKAAATKAKPQEFEGWDTPDQESHTKEARVVKEPKPKRDSEQEEEGFGYPGQEEEKLAAQKQREKHKRDKAKAKAEAKAEVKRTPPQDKRGRSDDDSVARQIAEEASHLDTRRPGEALAAPAVDLFGDITVPADLVEETAREIVEQAVDEFVAKHAQVEEIDTSSVRGGSAGDVVLDDHQDLPPGTSAELLINGFATRGPATPETSEPIPEPIASIPETTDPIPETAGPIPETVVAGGLTREAMEEAVQRLPEVVDEVAVITAADVEVLQAQVAADPHPLQAFAFPTPEIAVPTQDHGFFKTDDAESLSRAIAIAEERLGRPVQVYLELGSWLGKSCRHVLDQCPDAVAICIDTWKVDWHPANFEFLPVLWETFLANMQAYKDRVFPIRMETYLGIQEVVKAGVTPDLVYIDAGHEFADVLEDAAVCTWHWPGAVLVFDDNYAEFPGIGKLIKEFEGALQPAAPYTREDYGENTVMVPAWPPRKHPALHLADHR